MNNTTRQNLIVAIFMAATLVVGTLATATTTSTVFAYHQQQQKKKNKGSQDNGSRSNSNNGNTVTIEECKNKASASGFDTKVGQECENLICTHPGENSTCTQEGVVITAKQKPTTTTTPEPTTGETCVGCIDPLSAADKSAFENVLP
jgi:hypothetical protein